MHTFTLPFRGQELEIKIDTSLSEQKLFDIEAAAGEVVNSLTQILSPNTFKSLIDRLNDSDLNFPIEVTDDIWHYLRTNIEIAQRSEGRISAFTLDEKPVNSKEIADYYDLSTDLVVIRKQPVHFNSLVLIAPYILSQLEILLIDAGAKSFLISYHNMQIARGPKAWDISFSQPNGEESLEMTIQNEAAYMHLIPPNRSQAGMHNPFQAQVQAPTNIAILIETTNLLHARLIAAFAEEVSYEYQLRDFAQQWRCGLTVFTAQGEVKQFSA